MPKLKTAVVAFAALAALATLVPEPPLELPLVGFARRALIAERPPVLPPFVLPLVSIHPAGFDWSTGTGFVVDRARGLIATAAHIGTGTKFQVLLSGNVWLPATRIKNNAVADVALLALPDGMGELLPEAPSFRRTTVTTLEFTVADGWRVALYEGERNIVFRPVERMLGVTRTNATICAVSFESCQEVRAAVQRAIATGFVAERDRSLLYARYMLFTDTTDENHDIQYGLSGGPILDSSGSVVGVITLSNGYTLLAVPIDEVERLMR